MPSIDLSGASLPLGADAITRGLVLVSGRLSTWRPPTGNMASQHPTLRPQDLEEEGYSSAPDSTIHPSAQVIPQLNAPLKVSKLIYWASALFIAFVVLITVGICILVAVGASNSLGVILALVGGIGALALGAILGLLWRDRKSVRRLQQEAIRLEPERWQVQLREKDNQIERFSKLPIKSEVQQSLMTPASTHEGAIEENCRSAKAVMSTIAASSGDLVRIQQPKVQSECPLEKEEAKLVPQNVPLPLSQSSSVKNRSGPPLGCSPTGGVDNTAAYAPNNSQNAELNESKTYFSPPSWRKEKDRERFQSKLREKRHHLDQDVTSSQSAADEQRTSMSLPEIQYLDGPPPSTPLSRNRHTFGPASTHSNWTHQLDLDVLAHASSSKHAVARPHGDQATNSIQPAAISSGTEETPNVQRCPNPGLRNDGNHPRSLPPGGTESEAIQAWDFIQQRSIYRVDRWMDYNGRVAPLVDNSGHAPLRLSSGRSRSTSLFLSPRRRDTARQSLTIDSQEVGPPSRRGTLGSNDDAVYNIAGHLFTHSNGPIQSQLEPRKYWTGFKGSKGKESKDKKPSLLSKLALPWQD